MTADVAVVTGAARGIGRAIAERLAADGLHVAVADVATTEAEVVAASITAAGGRASAVEMDITDSHSVEAAREQVHAELGVPRVLVNNAGWNRLGFFSSTDAALWEEIVSINYLGTVRTCHTFLADISAAGADGRVINISSDSGRVGSMGEIVYSGAKGGIIAFSKGLAREVARTGATVNCVCPGPTDTPLLRAQEQKLVDDLIRAVPFRRLAQPSDIANAVSFFASQRSGYITGQTLSVSGGLTMS
jgi:2-hydroxycyclohexanecarboxyl-CoA dehydrogenase